MKTRIYRETETGVQYLSKSGSWTSNASAATLFDSAAAAEAFAADNGEDISASYEEADEKEAGA